jgi:hypothetical protein
MNLSFEIKLQNGRHYLPKFAAGDKKVEKALKNLKAAKDEDEDAQLALMQDYDMQITKVLRKKLDNAGADNVLISGDGREDRYSLFVSCTGMIEKVIQELPGVKIEID